MMQNRKVRTCSPFILLAFFASGAQKAPLCCSDTNMRGNYLPRNTVSKKNQVTYSLRAGWLCSLDRPR